MRFSRNLTGSYERSIAVQATCIPLNFLMLSVGILMAGIPTLLSLAVRVILVHFAAKTLQHHLPLSVGHVQLQTFDRRLLNVHLGTYCGLSTT